VVGQFAAADRVRKNVFMIHRMLKTEAVSAGEGPTLKEQWTSNVPRFRRLSGDILQYFVM